MKRIKHVLITTYIFFVSSGLASAVLPDKIGCTDHPIFPMHMPEYSIENCVTKDIDEFNFETGKKEKTGIEGRTTKLTYRIDECSKEASGLAVVRNYENAIKSIQGTVLFIDKNNNRFVNGKIVKDGKEIWAQVERGNGKGACRPVEYLKESYRPNKSLHRTPTRSQRLSPMSSIVILHFK